MHPRFRHERCRADGDADGSSSRSVGLLLVRPGGETRDTVDSSEQLAYELVTVFTRAQAVDLGHEACQGCLDIVDGLLRIVLTLLLQTPTVFGELFTIEVESDGRRLRGCWASRSPPEQVAIRWRHR